MLFRLIIALLVSMLVGDIAYIPRGVAHEALALRKFDTDSGLPEDISLHLTIGIETATHHSVEVLIFNYTDRTNFFPYTSNVFLLSCRY